MWGETTQAPVPAGGWAAEKVLKAPLDMKLNMIQQ